MSVCKPLWNILEPSHGGTALVEDPREVDEGAVAVAVAPLVLRAEPLARAAVGLAGRAGDEQVNESPQRLGIQAADAVAPNRRSPQRLCFHPGQERGRCRGFPFDITHGPKPVSKSVEGELDAGVVEARAGEDAEGLDGTIHIHAPPAFARTSAANFALIAAVASA